MNWLTNLVPPKIKALVKHDVPDNLWEKCPSCEQMIFHRELVKDLYVCKYCNHHLYMPTIERLKNLYDSSNYEVLPSPVVKQDPLQFRDKKKYTDRLKDAKANTGLEEAIFSVFGTINSVEVVSSVFNFAFIGGSMGTFVGESIVLAANYALEKHTPYIIFTSSGGARMQEGMLSLMQMPRTVAAINLLKKNALPYLVVHTNPTTGGVSASFAMLGDIHIAEPGAIIGFAGARVIQDTIKQNLPSNFQTSEYLLEHGMIDMIVQRKDLKDKISLLLSVLCNEQK